MAFPAPRTGWCPDILINCAAVVIIIKLLYIPVYSVLGSGVVIWRTLLVILGIVAIVAPTTLAWADERDFELINNSSSPINALFASPADNDVWGDNILIENVDPGDSRSILFQDELATCTYDVRVEFVDGSNGELRELDLCSTNTITLDDEFITAN